MIESMFDKRNEDIKECELTHALNFFDLAKRNHDPDHARIDNQFRCGAK
jgi:hypothetical protein